MNLVLNTVEAGHHHRREGEVGIGHRIGEANLESASFGARVVGNPNRCRTIACRVRENRRCLEARYESLIAVRRWVGERAKRFGVLDDTTDVIKRRV